MRVARFTIGCLVGALVLAVGVAQARADLTPIELLDPAQGQILATGAQIAFHIRTHPGDQYLRLNVSRSPAIADACGTIGVEADGAGFQPTADPSVYEATLAFFDFPSFWMNTPGTYYWQAYRIEYGEGADGCIESEVRTLTLQSTKATTLTVKAKASSNLSQIIVSSAIVHNNDSATVGRIEYILSGPRYRKTQSGRVEGGSDKKAHRFTHLKPGKYTLTAQYLGGVTGLVTYTASPVVTEHFTLRPRTLALSQARLEGSYNVVERFTSVSGIDLKVGSHDAGVWEFAPACRTAVCKDMRVTFGYGHVWDSNAQKVSMTRSGAAYGGSARASLLECGPGNEVVGTLTVELRVTKAAWIDDEWRALRLAGSARLAAPASTTGFYHCPAASYSATLRGSRASTS